MKPYRVLVTVALSAAFLSIGAGCQTAGGDVRDRDRQAEHFLNKKPEIFSLLDSSDRTAQSRPSDY